MVRVICTERFNEDWARLLQDFELPAAASPIARLHPRHGDPAYAAPRTSAAAAAYVREELYPLDARLHGHVCGHHHVT